MLFEDILIVLAILLFVAAVAIELRRDRDKKMYVGREAHTNAQPDTQPGAQANAEDTHTLAVRPEAQPPVVTQEEYKTPKKSA